MLYMKQIMFNFQSDHVFKSNHHGKLKSRNLKPQTKETYNKQRHPTHTPISNQKFNLSTTTHLLQELLLGGKTPTHVLRRALEQHSNYSDAEQPSSNKRTVVMVCGTFPLPVTVYTVSSVPSNPNPTFFFVYRSLAGREVTFWKLVGSILGPAQRPVTVVDRIKLLMK